MRPPVLSRWVYLTGLSQDTELEDDDDDGSTTVTNSIANLANPISCPAPVPTEELVARLESVMTTSIDEVKSVSELSLEEPSVIASPSAVDLPSHNEPTMAPPDDEPVANLVTVTQASAVDEIPVNSCCPCELPSDTTNAIAGPIYVDRKGTGLEAAVEIPTIVITPPSEVDPEDFAQQLDSEEEQGARESSIVPEFRDQLEPDSDCGGSEYDDDSELEYPHYPAHPVDEAALEPPQSPVDVRDDPCRSPIIVTGMLWSDNEGDDLGPLPFTEEITHAEETHTLEPTDTADIAEQPGVIDALEQNEARDSKGMCFTPLPIEKWTNGTFFSWRTRRRSDPGTRTGTTAGPGNTCTGSRRTLPCRALSIPKSFPPPPKPSPRLQVTSDPCPSISQQGGSWRRKQSEQWDS